MKLIHVADLHIGKRVNEYSMIDDQIHILKEIENLVREEDADAVLIAGDVYDKSQPPTDAVEVLDGFLTRLAGLGKPVLLISGNHDSPERLGFLKNIMCQNGIYIAGVYEGNVQKITLHDLHGPIHFYLLPYLKPAMLRPYTDEAPSTYDEAVRAALKTLPVNPDERNVLLAHQFITWGASKPERSDSEALSVGGLDNVDVSAFDGFDYVALGHLHGPQRIGRDTVRYAGSALKYSFSEAYHHKSAVLVELGEKGTVDIRLKPLIPLRDMRKIKGPLQALLLAGKQDPSGTLDYIYATLTDNEDIYDPLGQMREVYPNLMALDFERTDVNIQADTELVPREVAEKSPLNLFEDFFLLQNGRDMTRDQISVMEAILIKAVGESV